MRQTLKIIFLIVVLQTLNSCRSTNEMFHLRSHEVLSPNSELLSSTQYYLSQGDEISVKVYSNDGEKLLEPLAVNGQALSGDMISYTIESDGKANLPILGYFYLAGYTTREADSLLVIEYSKTIIEPYVQVRVLNKRAYVFPGGGESRAMVIPLENDQTSLVEALALVGGINNGKAQKIKLIRRYGNTSKIYMIDLSEYDEVQYASLVLQANDLIYVTPQSRISRKILEEVGPYLSLISTLAIIYNITAN